MPGERHTRNSGFVAIPRKQHALVFAERKEHRKNAGRGAAYEQEALPCAVGFGIGALGCKNCAFRRMEVVRAGKLRYIPRGERHPQRAHHALPFMAGHMKACRTCCSIIADGFRQGAGNFVMHRPAPRPHPRLHPRPLPLALRQATLRCAL